MQTSRRISHIPGEYNNGDDPLDLYVNELLRPADHEMIIDNFRGGKTWIRDIAGLTTEQQIDVITTGRTIAGGGSVPEHEFEAIASLSTDRAKIFTHFINGGSIGDSQVNAGKNMFVEMSRTYLPRDDYSGLSARQLEALLYKEFGCDVTGLLANQAVGDAQCRAIWARLAQEYPIKTIWYLAERLIPSAEFQDRQFGEALTRAKAGVGVLIDSLSLPDYARLQAREKLQLVSFSAFDHSLGGVTYHDAGSYGDYIAGTMRVEVKMEGSPSSPRLPTQERAYEVVQHELLHAVSAQNADASRSGLSIDGIPVLRRANEATTEFLNQLVQGRVEQQNGRTVAMGDARGYAGDVPKLGHLNDDDPEAFEALIHTYFGVREADRNALKRGLLTFR